MQAGRGRVIGLARESATHTINYFAGVDRSR